VRNEAEERAERTLADARGEAERIRDKADRIRPDVSLVDADDEITTYAQAERWQPGGEPPG
jgi:vacuolar-type H+-ATPase subunit E/Vma4